MMVNFSAGDDGKVSDKEQHMLVLKMKVVWVMVLCWVAVIDCFRLPWSPMLCRHCFVLPTRPLHAASSNDFGESLRESLAAPPEEIIKAVEKAPQYRLSVSDAAALGGVDLVQARTGLLTLSTLTGGDLQVTQDGEIVYTFSPDFKAKLWQRSPRIKLRRALSVIYPPLAYLVRVSFGVALFASLAVIASAVVVATSSSSSSNSEENKRGSSNSFRGSSINFGLSPFDYFIYRRDAPTYYDESPNAPDYTMPPESEAGGRPLSFLEAFFSFVFGDGDPNKTFSQAQLQQLSALIRQKGGVVVAEQLAPYLSPPMLPVPLQRSLPPATQLAIKEVFDSFPIYDGDAESTVVDESWMLPAVVKLGGEPLVSPDGNIYYQFPDLATTAMTTAKEAPASAQLFEKPVPFSNASPTQVLLAAALGMANLVGVGYIGVLLRSPGFLASAPVYASALQKLLPLLAGYAGVYLGTPLFRLLQLRTLNAEIRRRNVLRTSWSDVLLQPKNLPSSVGDKINEVEKHVGGDKGSMKRVIGGKGDVVYSTKQEE